MVLDKPGKSATKKKVGEVPRKKKMPTREELRQMILKLVKEKKLTYNKDIVALIPCSQEHYYALKLNDDDEINAIIRENIVNLKQKLKNKWEDSDNATLQTNLYRSIADDDEYRKLTKTSQDITTNGKDIVQPMVMNIKLILPDGFKDNE